MRALKKFILIASIGAVAGFAAGQTPVAPNAQPVAPNPNRNVSSPGFELLDGDRIAFLGDTFIEREQSYGYIEAALTSRFPNRNVTFRNLGWSADTPLGESRAGFDSPEKGFDRLKEQITALKPSVVFLGYGMASSFDGEAGLPKFSADMNRLIDTIQEICGAGKVRFVILSPIRHENLGPPLPGPTKHNAQLAAYTQALQEIAGKRAFQFIELFTSLRPLGAPSKMIYNTDDGIHLTAFGYRRVAEAIEQGLGWEPNSWRVGVTPQGTFRTGAFGITTSDLQKTDDKVRFVGLEDRVIAPPVPNPDITFIPGILPGRIQFAGMKPGRYLLKIDGEVVKSLSDQECQRSFPVDKGPHLNQAEQLRQAILKKNELFFHRWRPQNNTYLFLFRKNEQGQNAREIPQFDPLVQAEEERIAKLRIPVKHTYELVPATDEAQASKAAVPKAESAIAATPLPLPTFDVDPGFEISLYAENPLLAKPIQMNFDPQGRLWVASSSVYPQIQPGQTADDKILVLEDTDHDGKAEKSTVFAEGLLIPTGVEPGDGGCYVGQSTELLHFKDTDGDGKADQKQIVLSGFGTEDTHHILHTLRWGHDGQLYFNQSIYIHSHLETPHGVVRLNSGGVFNFRPPTRELEVFLRGFCNPWGHHFDEFGQSFETDGAGGQGISYGMRGATYFTYAAMRRELRSVSPGSYPKFCGLEIISSQHFPEDWQGNAITCDFRAHRVVRFSIAEQGSSYATKEMPDLVRSTNVTFRPIDVKIGPDGALYIADWSNPIIQHGEVDFRDARRDHEHGRIWRVTAKGRALVEKPKLINATHTALFDQLVSPNGFNQQQSRRVLTERGTNIVSDLARWTASQTSEKNLLQSLWMYQSVDVVEPELLEKLLHAQDGRIRAAAVRVLSFWSSRVTNGFNLLAERVADEHPRVRLEVMRALGKIPTARSADLVLSALSRPMDDFLDYGLWLSINDLARPWIDSILSDNWKPEGHERELEFGLKSVEPALASKVFTKLVAGKPIPATGNWIELIGQAGSPNELRQLFDQVLQGGFDEASTARALTALNEAARLRKAKPAGDLAGLGNLLQNSGSKAGVAAVRLVGTWKLKPFASQLVNLAQSQSAPAKLAQAAIESLREIGGAEAIEGLRALAEKGSDLTLRRQAVVALAALDLNKSLPQIMAIASATTQPDEAVGLWRALLSIKGAAPALARALPKTGFPPDAAKAGLRVARESGRNEPDLVLALSRAGNLEDESQNLTPAEIQALVAKMKSADPARGEIIFRRKDLSCTVCHAIGGAGGKVGPDLTSLGASAPPDYLIESVLAPNKTVKEGYHSIQVQTKDGQEFSGVLVRETSQELILRDATNKEVSIPKNNIDERRLGGSLMPSGMVDNLTSEERLDLFRFLSELGKPGPYDASQANVARVWKLRPGTHDNEQFGEEKFVGNDPNGAEWQPTYSLADGRLLRDQLQDGAKAGKWIGVVGLYAATQLQVAKAGPVSLKFSGAANTPVWIDGKPATTGSEVSPNLTAGVHTIVVRLDPKKLPDHLRLESSDGTFLAN